MSVFDYLVTAQPVDPCAPFKGQLADALQMLESAESRAFQNEQANKVLTVYALVIGLAFIVPAITMAVKMVAGRFEDWSFFGSGLIWSFADLLEYLQSYIPSCIVVAGISSLVNTLGVKEGSLILPTDPLTTGHKFYVDWRGGQSLSLYRTDTSSNMVDSLRVGYTILVIYVIAYMGASQMTWIVMKIRSFAAFNIWFARGVSDYVLWIVSWVDAMNVHVLRIFMGIFVNKAIEVWTPHADTSNEYIVAALALHKMANEGLGGIIQHMVHHFVSNATSGGFPAISNTTDL
jgi:hypothetical protein